MNKEFDFNQNISKVKYNVENLLPAGHFVTLLAQSGGTKSLLLNALAIHTVCEIPFCGFETAGGDVLLIDQDTPTDVVKRRLQNFQKALDIEPKHSLFLLSMESYKLKDGSLLRAIQEYPTARLVIIDCLHSVCGNLNPNSTQDMSIWNEINQSCRTPERTILVAHHISEKTEYTVNELMTMPTHKLAMGSSAINQQVDAYYIIGSDVVEGRAERVYIRVVSKRITIPCVPFTAKISANGNGYEKFEFDFVYSTPPEEIALDVKSLFSKQVKERTIIEMYNDMGGKHPMPAIRKTCSDLERTQELVCSRLAHNLFKYRLPNKKGSHIPYLDKKTWLET